MFSAEDAEHPAFDSTETENKFVWKSDSEHGSCQIHSVVTSCTRVSGSPYLVQWVDQAGNSYKGQKQSCTQTIQQ